MKGSNWLFFVIGMSLGVAAGLYYSWVANPVEYFETAPDSLRADFRADYLALIASAYSSGGDLVRARARLALFPGIDSADELAALAQQRLAVGLSASEAGALAQLANALSRGPISTAAATVDTPRITPTPSPTARASRRPRPTSTPGAAFVLTAREQVCDRTLSQPLLQVVVLNAAAGGVPGMEVIVVWDTGQDHFFTGLKPELGLGYGDFTMSGGTSYTLRLGEYQQLVTDLAAQECLDDGGEPYLGSWLIQFEQSG